MTKDASRPAPDDGEPVTVPMPDLLGKRLLQLARAIPPLGWLFVLIAGVYFVNLAPDLLFSSTMTPDFWILEIMHLLYATLVLLMPAAVLVWRRDLRSSVPVRWVLLAAVVWGLPTLYWFVASRFLPSISTGAVQPLLDYDTTRANLRLVRYALAVAAIGAPALMAWGLSGTRLRSATTWPLPLVAVAVIGTLILVGIRLPNVFGDEYSIGGYTNPQDLNTRAFWLVQACAVASPLSHGVLAWSSLSALRGGDAPAGQWRLLAIGAAMGAAVALYGVVIGIAAQWVPDVMNTPFMSVWAIAALEVIAVAAIAAVLCGFLAGHSAPAPSEGDEALGAGSAA